GDAGPEREIFESQIRRFDNITGVEVDGAGSADADCSELILIDTGFFDCSTADAGYRCEDLFVIAPSPGFCSRTGDNDSRGIQNRSHYLCSAQIYSQYVTPHLIDRIAVLKNGPPRRSLTLGS